MTGDLSRLQGAWDIVALEVEGRSMPAPDFHGARIIVAGERFTTVGMGASYSGTVRVNPDSRPRTFDLRFANGPHAGLTSPGIYELDAERWTLCLGLAGRGRPSAFETTPGSGHVLEVLQRSSESVAQRPVEREAEASAASVAPAPELAGISGEWQMVSAVRDGQVLDQEFVSSGRRVLSGNITTVTFRGKVFMQGRTSVDASRSPKTIDYVLTHSPGKGKLQLGIYEFDGETLRVCMGLPGQPRPTDFTSREGADRTLTEWRKKA